MERFMNADHVITEIIFAERVYAPGNPVHKNRASHGLALFVEGNNRYDFGDKTFSVGKNEIIFMPKGSDYYVTVQQPGVCFCINFNVAGDASFSPFVFRLKNGAEFAESFKRCGRMWRSGTPGYALKCKAELYGILYNIQKEYRLGYSGRKIEILRPAVEYIHDKYTSEIISVAVLSDMCGISPEYFRSIFRSCYGTPPIKYINNLKLTRAKNLMMSGMYSISESAYLSGYSDISYFSREFKKNVGVSPSEYVRTVE